MTSNLRTGIGYDIHPLKAGRKLVLGGIEIPYEKGPDGWSDADVLTHAIVDAMLGAAVLGDIGGHFPPGDPEYKDISSINLLKKADEKLKRNGLLIVNIDTTVLAEQPKLAGYIDKIRRNLARALNLNMGRISVKASTCNGLGAIGAGEGIAACATVLLEGGKP